MENTSSNIRPLKLNVRTVAVLDNKAMQEIKGGRGIDPEEPSCTSGKCDGSCRNASRHCELQEF